MLGLGLTGLRCRDMLVGPHSAVSPHNVGVCPHWIRTQSPPSVKIGNRNRGAFWDGTSIFGGWRTRCHYLSLSSLICYLAIVHHQKCIN